jgi:ABC-type transporter MlaC component
MIAGDRAIRTHHAAAYLWIAAAALALPVAASAQSAAPQVPVIDDFVAEIADGIRAIHAQAGGDAAKAIGGCRDLLGRTLDLAAVAQAATEDAWSRMSAPQREAYQAGVAQRFAAECARQLADYKGEAIALAGIRPTGGGDRLATQRLGEGGNARMIAWRLRRTSDGKFRAVDVVWEGHSAVAKAREEFLASLQSAHGNVDALIESMRK